MIDLKSKLLELPEITALVGRFDPHSLSWPWQHPDARVDRLQQAVMSVVASGARRPRADVFAQIAAAAGARGQAGGKPGGGPGQGGGRPGAGPGQTPPHMGPGQTPPHMTEAWYCCAEPGPDQGDLV